ncbi:MAG TPA: helix-hairpin-helix domain-containing protein, partial [Xanthomonadaceae bacterium]|nr:helix-hairpin-helix domain-containing protein [Xanthomonadaceae bacterium]
LSLPGMDEATAYVLASRGVCTREDFAELAVDEITDIEDMDAERAAALIMEARRHWFE